MDWYYNTKEGKKGPVDTDVIKNLIKEGVLLSTDYVWNKTMGDKWSRIEEVPVLLVPQATENFGRGNQPAVSFQEVYRMQARERLVRRGITLAVIALIAGIGYGSFSWIKNKPYRRLGINEKNPLGQFVVLDKLLATENMMDKGSVQACALTELRAAQMCAYSNPKAPRGAAVSGSGSIILLTDEQGKMKGLHALFPTPGALVNESAVSIFTKNVWNLMTKDENLKLDQIITATPQMLEPFALTTVLKDSNFAVLVARKPGVRGLWLQYGPNGQSTMVLLCVAE